MDQDPMVVAPADGVVRGDDKPMPDRGTSSGMLGMGAPYGADIGLKATNSRGSAHMDGDPADLCYPKGDADLRFSSSGGGGHPDPGTHMSGSDTDSDPADEDSPDTQQIPAADNGDAAEDASERKTGESY